MAAGTGRSAHLTVVDTITESHHLCRRVFGDGGARIRVCALRRLGRGGDDSARRSRRTWAWGDGAGITYRAALIDNSIDPSAHIVGNVERPVGSDRESGRPMRGTLRCH